MKVLAILPHGNTAAFLEEERIKISEKTGRKLFSFSPLYYPLAFVPDIDYTEAEAKAMLVETRNVISGKTGGKCFINGVRSRHYKGTRAFFCTLGLPFKEELKAFFIRKGWKDIDNDQEGLRQGFCLGFYKNDEKDSPEEKKLEELSWDASYEMTVFRLAIINFQPQAPFLEATEASDEGSDSSQILSFRWSLLSSVWKGKEKGA